MYKNYSIVSQFSIEGRFDQLAFFNKNSLLKLFNMDSNGNRWQPSNDSMIDSLKQQLATMRQQLARNGENLR